MNEIFERRAPPLAMHLEADKCVIRCKIAWSPRHDSTVNIDVINLADLGTDPRTMCYLAHFQHSSFYTTESAHKGCESQLFARETAPDRLHRDLSELLWESRSRYTNILEAGACHIEMELVGGVWQKWKFERATPYHPLVLPHLTQALGEAQAAFRKYARDEALLTAACASLLKRYGAFVHQALKKSSESLLG